MSFFFFFNDTATTEIYTLSLHDALPIYSFTTLVSAHTLYLLGMECLQTGLLFILQPVSLRSAPNIFYRTSIDMAVSIYWWTVVGLKLSYCVDNIINVRLIRFLFIHHVSSAHTLYLLGLECLQTGLFFILQPVSLRSAPDIFYRTSIDTGCLNLLMDCSWFEVVLLPW